MEYMRMQIVKVKGRVMNHRVIASYLLEYQGGKKYNEGKREAITGIKNKERGSESFLIECNVYFFLNLQRKLVKKKY